MKGKKGRLCGLELSTDLVGYSARILHMTELRDVASNQPTALDFDFKLLRQDTGGPASRVIETVPGASQI